MKISIVIPAHNEEGNIEQVIRKIESSLGMEHELIVVDDHSRDATCEIVERLKREFPRLRLIHNLNEKGFANALRSGFASVTGDAVLPVMGDLCDDMGTVGEMVKRIDSGYDIVCGSRYMKGGSRSGGSRLKGFLSAAGGWSLHILFGVPTHDISNAFKMYRRKVIETVKTEAKGFEISMELPLKAYYAGFSMTEVPTAWKEREKGTSNFKVFRLLPKYLKLYLWAVKKRLKG